MIKINPYKAIRPLVNPKLNFLTGIIPSKSEISRLWAIYRQGDTGSALTETFEALNNKRIHPQHLYVAQRLIGINLTLAEAFKEAELFYRLALKNAKSFLDREGYQELEREYKILKNHPHYQKGLFLTSIFQREKAVAVFKQLLEENHNFLPAHLFCAENYFALGKYKEAADEYKIAINGYEEFSPLQPSYIKMPEIDDLLSNYILTVLLYAALKITHREDQEAQRVINDLYEFLKNRDKQIPHENLILGMHIAASKNPSQEQTQMHLSNELQKAFGIDSIPIDRGSEAVLNLVRLIKNSFLAEFFNINDRQAFDILQKNLEKVCLVVERINQKQILAEFEKLYSKN